MARRARSRARSAGAPLPSAAIASSSSAARSRVDRDDRHADAAGAERRAAEPLGVAGGAGDSRAAANARRRLRVGGAGERVAARDQQVRALERPAPGSSSSACSARAWCAAAAS